mgnify:CR=1 FL=1
MKRNYEEPKLEMINFSVEDNLMNGDIQLYAANPSIPDPDPDEPIDPSDPWN